MRIRLNIASRLLTKSASGVLAALRGSTYGGEYASPLRLLRPCWTAFVNSLRPIVRSSVTCSVLSAEALRRVCQQTASWLGGTSFVDSEHDCSTGTAIIGRRHNTVLTVRHGLVTMWTELVIPALLPPLAEFNGVGIRHSHLPLFCADA